MAEWAWAGSKWWKMDFHTHTPVSDDYGKGPNQEQLRMLEPKDWLLNFMRAGVDCIAVTDHNSGAWINTLKEALLDLERDNNPDYRPLFIFPGVEISVHGGVHILAILSTEKSNSDIDSLIGAVKYRGVKGSSDSVTECLLSEVVEEINRVDGIAIPAHVDQRNGVFIELAGTTLEQDLAQLNISAIEVKDATINKPQIYIDKRINWAEVLGSDSHHPTGTNGDSFPGSHFTWVKMSIPSSDGLRLALIDGGLSLKRSDQFTGDPNGHGQLAVESIVVEDAKYLGRGGAFSCNFNPWLNTIIGGRGTGKSTIIEFLRMATKRSGELPKSLEQDFGKYSRVSRSRDDDGLLIEQTKIIVIYRKDGVRFRLKYDRSKIDGEFSLEEETSSNVWIPTDGDIAQRFPVRIYSQKQIFEIAKQPQALLQIVDEAEEVDQRGWAAEWEELTSKYLALKAQEREFLVSLKEETVYRGQLEDFKRKIEVYERAENTGVLKTYQIRENQARAIEAWDREWAGLENRVNEFTQPLIPPDINSELFSNETLEEKELLNEVAQVRKEFAGIYRELSDISERIRGIRQRWLTRKTELLINAKLEESRLKYHEMSGQLIELGVGSVSDYGKSIEQKQRVEEKLQAFDKKRLALEEIQEQAQIYIDRIIEHRKKITALRERFLQSTLAGNPLVQIKVIPYGNKDLVEEDFRRLIDRPNGFERDIGSMEAEEGILFELQGDPQQPIEERIQSVKNQVFKIYGGEIDGRDHRFATHIRGLSPERLDRLLFWFPADSLEVSYSLNDGGGYQSVNQGSPGQKTAALLAFLLSYGNEPLVLDQPEDDLDNHLIYTLIVNQLREMKQKRQVIIVTHNANIVVNGDAENVIVLDVRSGLTRIITQGGLQEIPVRHEICRILEGGEEAFNLRYKRLNAGR